MPELKDTTSLFGLQRSGAEQRGGEGMGRRKVKKATRSKGCMCVTRVSIDALAYEEPHLLSLDSLCESRGRILLMRSHEWGSPLPRCMLVRTSHSLNTLLLPLPLHLLLHPSAPTTCASTLCLCTFFPLTLLLCSQSRSLLPF